MPKGTVTGLNMAAFTLYDFSSEEVRHELSAIEKNPQ